MQKDSWYQVSRSCRFGLLFNELSETSNILEVERLIGPRADVWTRHVVIMHELSPVRVRVLVRSVSDNTKRTLRGREPGSYPDEGDVGPLEAETPWHMRVAAATRHPGDCLQQSLN